MDYDWTGVVMYGLRLAGTDAEETRILTRQQRNRLREATYATWQEIEKVVTALAAADRSSRQRVLTEVCASPTSALTTAVRK